MNKTISPTLIGAFVMGALGLLVAAVVAFGSGQLFRKTKNFVLYFDGSVNGLHIGAPVKFKGVEIGSVTDILLQMTQNMQVTKIPVIIEIDLKKMTSRGASGEVAEQQEAFQKAIHDRGLRGQLQTESLVTGVLYVALDFFPESPINLVQQPNGNNKYPEIPTVPTALEQAQDAVSQIIKKLEEIDFKELIKSLSETVSGVDQLVNSPAVKSTLRQLDQTMPKIDAAVVSFNKLANNVDGTFTSLSNNLAQTSDATRQAMNQAENTLRQTDASLKAAEGAMTNIKDAIDPESPTFYEIGKSLREVSAAARALRLLGNYIERNPRALIFGKPENQEGK
ncbi:MAG TPA: MlaD family protein [Candidatus Binatia bacterium]|jgi:paraquat-inducible protein B